MIEVTEYEAYLCIASFSLRFRSDKGLTHERLLVFGNSTLIISSFDIKFAWLKFFVRQLSKTCTETSFSRLKTSSVTRP